MSQSILTTQSDHVLTLRFNRPDKRNAITQAMYTTLAEALHKAAEDDACRVVVFAGTEDCFTAGNDLKDFMTGLEGDLTDAPVLRFLRVAAQFPKPMIAAVNGHAVGIGTTLLMHCDLICAGDNSKFQLPFTSLGLVPEFASSLLLPRITGYPKAAEWLLLGQPFGPVEAKEAGLINAIAPSDQVEAQVMHWAQTLAEQPPEALRASRALMRATSTEDTMQAIEREAEVFQQRLQSKEFAAQVARFFER